MNVSGAEPPPAPPSPDYSMIPTRPPAAGPPQPQAPGDEMARALLRVADVGIRVLAGFLATALAVELALVEAFLLPMRIRDVPVPMISFALALVGNAALIWFARYGTGSGLGIVAPCVAWLGTMLTLASRTTEGDLVLTGDWRGLGLLFAGAGVLAVAGFVAVTPRARRPATRPPATQPEAVGEKP